MLLYTEKSLNIFGENSANEVSLNVAIATVIIHSQIPKIIHDLVLFTLLEVNPSKRILEKKFKTKRAVKCYFRKTKN